MSNVFSPTTMEDHCMAGASPNDSGIGSGGEWAGNSRTGGGGSAFGEWPHIIVADYSFFDIPWH